MKQRLTPQQTEIFAAIGSYTIEWVLHSQGKEDADLEWAKDNLERACSKLVTPESLDKLLEV